MKTIDLLYKPILTSIGLTINEEDAVLRGSEPWTVAGNPVILPTKANTKELAEDKVYFHPLSEDFFIGGQSAVLKRLKRSMLVTADTNILLLAIELHAIATNVRGHEKLTPKQHGLISNIPEIKATHGPSMARWVKSLEPKADGGNLLTLFLKENLSVEGHRYKRGAIIRFDLVKQLVEMAAGGVALEKLTNPETATLAGVFAYILNPWKETYSQEFGSDNGTAPYLAALLEAYGTIMQRLNYLHALFWDLTSPTYQQRFPDPKIMVECKWAQPAEWIKFFREIPPLSYNRGNEEQEAKVAPGLVLDADRDTVKVKAKPAPVNGYTQQPVAESQQVTEPVQEKKSGALTDNRGGVKVINLADLPNGTIPQYDAWGNPVNVNNTTFYQAPAQQQFVQQQPTFQQPQQNNQRPVYQDAYGRLIDVNGNVLGVPVNGTGNTFQQPNTFQPQNQFSNGPFTPQVNNGFNTGFNNGGFNGFTF